VSRPWNCGNEGLDRSLAELAEVLFDKRIGELDDAFAEGNVRYEQAKRRVTAARNMSTRYAENAERGWHPHQLDWA
jgi:hypothetical protein